MFALDIETLSNRETAVVLSLAILHFDEKETYTYKELLDNTCFVKFNLKEQIEVYERTTNKETIDWWKKQCDIVKNVSLVPKKTDMNAIDGLKVARDYIKSKSQGDEIVWTRGSLDQFAIDSLCDSVKVPYLFNYGQYRDFRTAIDLLKETSVRGYCTIPDFNRDIAIKHDPVHDVALDVMMLLFGK
jgi:hypothetical protein